MAGYTFTPKYEIGEHVYLNVNEGEEHLISNIMFNVLDNKTQYQLMDSNGYKALFSELDITDSKIIK